MGDGDGLIFLVIGGIAFYFMLATCTLQKMLGGMPGAGAQILPMVDQIAQALGITGCPTATTTPPPPVPTTTTPGVTPVSGAGEIYLNLRFNNNANQIQFRFDSGADLSVMRTESAALAGISTANPVRMQNITTVSGAAQAPVVSVNMQIETTTAFQTEMVVMNTSFNLLSRNDLNRVYDIEISAEGTRITPRGQAFYTYVRNPPPYSRRNISL